MCFFIPPCLPATPSPAAFNGPFYINCQCPHAPNRYHAKHNYSQTFDHRSSLGFALAAGFAAGVAAGGAGSPQGAAEIGAVKLGTAGVSRAAVFHPPKSSSAVIVGGEGFAGENEDDPKPPPPGGD